MLDPVTNFAITTVSVAPSPSTSGASLTVTDSSSFPTGDFNVIIFPTNTQPTSLNAEIVRVTNIAGNVLTITRQQEGTTARDIIAGDQVMLGMTAKVYNDIVTEINTKTASGAVTRDGSGYISVVTKDNGVTLTITRDGNGYISSITDGVKTWTVNRDGSNLITDWVVT